MNVVRFALLENSPVRLTIYDRWGRQVRELLSGHLPAGEHQARWDGTDSQGRTTSHGVYFYRLVSASFTEVRKLIRK